MGFTDATLARVLTQGYRTHQACSDAQAAAPAHDDKPTLLRTLRQAHQLAVHAQAPEPGMADAAHLHYAAMATEAAARHLVEVFEHGNLRSDSQLELLWACDLAADIQQFGPHHLMDAAMVRRIQRKAQTLQITIETSHLWPAISATC